MNEASDVARLRESFDQAFAQPHVASERATVRMLRIEVGSLTALVRLDQVGGVHVDRRIVPLPGAASPLLGLVGVHGRLRAAYDLGPLLDGAQAAGSRRRWLALTTGATPIALCFDRLHAQLEVPADELRPVSGPIAMRHASTIARVGTDLIPVADFAALARELTAPVSAEPQESL